MLNIIKKEFLNEIQQQSISPTRFAFSAAQATDRRFESRRSITKAFILMRRIIFDARSLERRGVSKDISISQSMKLNETEYKVVFGV